MPPTSVTFRGQGHRAPDVCSLVLARWVSRVFHARQRQGHGQRQGEGQAEGQREEQGCASERDPTATSRRGNVSPCSTPMSAARPRRWR